MDKNTYLEKKEDAIKNDIIINAGNPAEVGNYLKSALKERHMTYENLAELMFVDVRTVGRWLKGSLNSIALILEIKNVLQLDGKVSFVIE